MRVIHSATELAAGPRKVCVGIGFFDGVHLGHQQIIRQTVADARQHEGVALIVTFDRHPNTVVAPERVPPLIYTLPQKLRAISSLGVHSLLLIHFDRAFSEQTGEVFTRALARDLQSGSRCTDGSNRKGSGIQSICVGASFVFGHKRSGNVGLLRKLGAALNFHVHDVAAVSLDGKPVSSTRIREAIAVGNLDLVGQMLGRPYSIMGKVVRGDGVGAKLGFPTANVETTGLALPPRGVYATHALVKGGKNYRAVLNIGIRPTVATRPEPRTEAHLIDFHGDLYDQEIEIVFGERLREEKKFASLSDLRHQIAQDILDAQMRF